MKESEKRRAFSLKTIEKGFFSEKKRGYYSINTVLINYGNFSKIKQSLILVCTRVIGLALLHSASPISV